MCSAPTCVLETCLKGHHGLLVWSYHTKATSHYKSNNWDYLNSCILTVKVPFSNTSKHSLCHHATKRFTEIQQFFDSNVLNVKNGHSGSNFLVHKTNRIYHNMQVLQSDCLVICIFPAKLSWIFKTMLKARVPQQVVCQQVSLWGSLWVRAYPLQVPYQAITSPFKDTPGAFKNTNTRVVTRIKKKLLTVPTVERQQEKTSTSASVKIQWAKKKGNTSLCWQGMALAHFN